MTIPGFTFEGWPIAPQYQPVPLVRSPKVKDLSKLFQEKVEEKGK